MKILVCDFKDNLHQEIIGDKKVLFDLIAMVPGTISEILEDDVVKITRPEVLENGFPVAGLVHGEIVEVHTTVQASESDDTSGTPGKLEEHEYKETEDEHY